MEENEPLVENKTVEIPQERVDGPKKKSEKQPSHLDQFFKKLDEQKDAEAKLAFAMNFMKEAIGQEKHPDFKAFWEARVKSLALFKENIAPFARAQLWNQFSELSKEARGLKDLLDEQSDFAAEQIDIAILAIEKEIQGLLDSPVDEDAGSFLAHARSLRSRVRFYAGNQRALDLLNLLATRITSLRKELIKTEMRIRSKNKFFERLSKAGDFVFPRRKTLIQEISGAFLEDVSSFIKASFEGADVKSSIFELRDEIKALQSAAKDLTLSTDAFSQTRLHLSKCWDKLKEMDQEKKVEFDKLRGEFEKNGAEIKALIEADLAKFEAGESSVQDALNFLDETTSLMRQKELGRKELAELRSLILSFREKIQKKQKVQEEERLKQEELRQQEKRKLFADFQDRCVSFIDLAKQLQVDEIQKQKETLLQEIQKSTLSKADRLELEKVLRPLKDLIREKKETALLALPADEQKALAQLRDLLRSKKELRQEIKEQLDKYRKVVGSSGLAFEKAMEYGSLIEVEKEKFETAQQQVREVEQKIEQLENKISLSF